ncbi:MAG: leucine-rich repeat protein, partial [Clostridiaceae bacterium]|nr:leucine-rich repeat protein [Clostridiaceae bacterium]
TAQWEVVTYSLKYFEYGNGEGSILGTTLQTVEYGNSGTAVTAVANDGYYFVMWSDGLTDNPRTDTNVRENIDVIAIFDSRSYTVSFKNWDETILKTQSVKHGQSAIEPSVTERIGYIFAGWDKSLSNITADTIITAQYNPRNYTITYDSAGGSYVEPLSQGYGTDITAPVNPTKDNYTFIGWLPEIPAKMGAENITVTAQWKLNEYVLTFNSNEGSIVNKIEGIIHDSTVTMPTDPIKEGYEFSGWYVDNETFELIFNQNTKVTSNLTVYAKWVSKSVSDVVINKKVTAILLNSSETLIACVLPEIAENKSLTWSSSNEAVATVDTNGKVTGLSIGQAIITATSYESAVTEKCTVVVYTETVETDFIIDTIDNKTVIKDYVGNGGNVVIPVTINEKTLNIINTDAFRDCYNIVSVAFQSGSTVSEIGDYAFYGCNNLVSIEFTDKITTIGKLVFGNCSSLEDINVSEENSTYVSIDGVLYSKDESLLISYPAGKTDSSFTVPDSVTTISEGAFWYCKNLQNIFVSEGNISFSSIDGILYNKDKTELVVYPGGKTETSYTVPRIVTSIVSGAFGYAYNLLNIYVEEGNMSFSSVEGVLYDKIGTTLVAYPTGRPDYSFS